jgi:hypothetical protein
MSHTLGTIGAYSVLHLPLKRQASGGFHSVTLRWQNFRAPVLRSGLGVTQRAAFKDGAPQAAGPVDRATGTALFRELRTNASRFGCLAPSYGRRLSVPPNLRRLSKPTRFAQV